MSHESLAQEQETLWSTNPGVHPLITNKLLACPTRRYWLKEPLINSLLVIPAKAGMTN